MYSVSRKIPLPCILVLERRADSNPFIEYASFLNCPFLMYYVQDVELQKDEAFLKWVSFPKRQWNDTINVRT